MKTYKTFLNKTLLTTVKSIAHTFRKYKATTQ